MNKNLLALLVLILVSGQLFAQKMGQWKDYLSYKNCYKVTQADDKIYCVSDGGLFYFDTSDNSVAKVTRSDGLSDFGIKTIAYQNDLDVLLIAYNNSNIDLFFEDRVVNISDLKRKMLSADKTIYNILFVGNEAYLSCGFGILVINLDKQEIKDTYYIGQDGGFLSVYDMEYDGEYLYAATETGIYQADYNNPNLIDFKNWTHIDDIPNSNSKFSHLVFHANHVIACYKDFFYINNDGNWSDYFRRFDTPSEMQVQNNYLTIASKTKIYIVDENNQTAAEISAFAFQDNTENNLSTLSAFFSPTTGLWAADENLGLINTKTDLSETIYPEGPIYNDVFYLYENNNNLFVAPGGVTGIWNKINRPAGIMRLNNDQWTYFTEKEYPELEGKTDIIKVMSDPNNPEHFFAASWANGIIEFNNDQFVDHFDNNNSPLETSSPSTSHPENYIRVGGIAFDSHGTLWATNSDVTNVLVSRSSNGDWESYTLNELINEWVTHLLVSKNNDKWIVVYDGNLHVVNDDASEDTPLSVIAYFNNGDVEIKTPMSEVLSIAEDKDGEIWLGTTIGVAVYSNPHRLWDTGFIYASQPSLELNDGLFHPLLQNTRVTAICVDGANRKWLGTEGSGVYLVSENGDTELQHFTTENSPLLSNNIRSIAILSKTGEVFIATDKGIISYMGDATEGGGVFEDVYAYPNPVREDYDGPIVIEGLINDTDLKITDISGNLVYSTTSLGGQATWDGKNLNGNRVKTGVYLIFCSDQEGEETCITKLLFIH